MILYCICVSLVQLVNWNSCNNIDKIELCRLLRAAVAVSFLLKTQSSWKRWLGEGRHKMSTLLWCQCSVALFVPPASTSSRYQKAVEKSGGRGWRFSNCQTSNGGRFFRRRANRLPKLCGLVGRFMAPDEITVRSAVPWIMRVAVVLYRLCRCAERCLVSNQSVAKSLCSTIFFFFCAVYEKV